MNWDDLRFALAVADAGSLSAAAEAMGVNASTVLRRIAALEKAVGSRLFERGRAGYRLTPEGAELVSALRPVQQRIGSIERGFQHQAEGTEAIVRMAAPAGLSVAFLASRIMHLRAEQPGIVVQLSTNRGLPPAALGPLDIALCYGRPVQGDMVTRKLADVGYGLYGPPEQLPRGDRANAEPDISRLPLLGFGDDEVPSGPVDWLAQAGADSNIIFRSGDAGCRLTAAQSGMGFAVLPCFMADEVPGLTRLAGPDSVGFVDLWLVTHRQARDVSRISVLVDFLVRLTRSRRERLAGLS